MWISVRACARVNDIEKVILIFWGANHSTFTRSCVVAEKSTPPEIRVTITPDARGKRDDNCTLVSSNVPPPYDKASNDGNTSHGAAVSRQGDNNTNNINNNTMSSAVLLSANKQQKAMLCRNYHMQSINTIPSHPLPISLSLSVLCFHAILSVLQKGIESATIQSLHPLQALSISRADETNWIQSKKWKKWHRISFKINKYLFKITVNKECSIPYSCLKKPSWEPQR